MPQSPHSDTTTNGIRVYAAAEFLPQGTDELVDGFKSIGRTVGRFKDSIPPSFAVFVSGNGSDIAQRIVNDRFLGLVFKLSGKARLPDLCFFSIEGELQVHWQVDASYLNIMLVPVLDSMPFRRVMSKRKIGSFL